MKLDNELYAKIKKNGQSKMWCKKHIMKSRLKQIYEESKKIWYGPR